MPKANRTPQLLVSVRSAAEAAAALAGGADLIDVKEPARGALGRADDATIAAVIECVAGRRPVSAALGELAPHAMPVTPPGLRYGKWGLAGWGRKAAWQAILRALYRHQERARAPTVPHDGSGCRLVPVAYADWRSAAAPPVEDVCAFVRQYGSVVLLDTFAKTPGATLLDYLPAGEIARLCRLCQAAGVKVGLAGSLGLAQIAGLKAASPDWFAVRGAACADGRRDAPITVRKVRELADLIRGNQR